MNNKERMLLGAGVIAVVCAVTLRPAYSAERADDEALPHINQAAVVGEDARLDDAVNVRVAPAAAPIGDEALHCNYLATAPDAGGQTFRFADGNRVVFPASGQNRIRFVAADGATTQIEDGEAGARKSWWCQEDGVVLFRTVQAAAGNLSAVKVEWFDSRGARRAETQLNLPPAGEKVTWSYEGARPVDDCLGLTFRVQEGKASHGPAKLVEYKICPKGI